MTPLDTLLRWAVPLCEAALSGADATLEASRRALRRVAGESAGTSRQESAGTYSAGTSRQESAGTSRQESAGTYSAGTYSAGTYSGTYSAGTSLDPVDGATSELANHLLRTVRRAGLGPADVVVAWREAWRTAWTRLPDEPCRLLTLPLEVPLACASLATQEGWRSLATLQAVPLGRMGELLSFVLEVFSDLETFFSLRYPQEIARLRAHLERRPDDARTRRELGRLLTKCGLFDEALVELRRAAQAPGERRDALYAALVAAYRAGDEAGAWRDGVACLEADPGHERARYWLWLTAAKAGGYPPEVPAALRLVARDGHHPLPFTLIDVAAELGLDKTCGGRGTAIFPSRGDGPLDLAVAGAHAGVSLYRNPGRAGGPFTEVATGSGLDAAVYSFALAAGDYDNDGLPDLFVSSLGFFNGRSALLHNNCDGTFTYVSAAAGLDLWGPAFTATWVDFDNDGWLDLFVAYNLGGLFDRKTPNRLFHNNGDGTFTDVTRGVGLATPATTIGAAWGDFTNSGRPDLFVSNLGRPQLFRNHGRGFHEVGREAGLDRPAIGSVALAADVDDDGWLDVVQLTYSPLSDAIHTLRHGHGPPDGCPLRVFRNNRDGTFTDVAPDLGLDGCWGTMSAAIGDFDNDGYQDLWLGNGDPSMDRLEPAILYKNDGGRRFHNVTFAAGLPAAGKGHGVNMADFLGDGRLHLVVASGGLYPGDLLTTSVYRPTVLPGNFLNVRLRGTISNRDAIGARLCLRAAGREQHRLVSGGSHFGCLPLEQHFGLGTATEIETLEVRWPSGRVERLAAPPINITLRLTEGREGFEEVYNPS